jgi:hypothetical protein
MARLLSRDVHAPLNLLCQQRRESDRDGYQEGSLQRCAGTRCQAARDAANVAIDPAYPHSSFRVLEEQIESADVAMDFYGVMVSPGTRKILPTTPSFPGGSLATWSEIRGAKLAGTDRRTLLRSLLEQYDVLFVANRINRI